MNEQRIRIIKVLTVSAVIFVLFLLSAMVINLVTIAQKNTEEHRLSQELERLNQIIALNNEDIKYKETEEFIEKFSRDQHNLIRNEEEAFVGSSKNN